MSYKFLKDISIADVAFDASAQTLEKLFIECAKAVTNTMVRDLKSVKQKTKITIKVEADTVENLLFNYLNEIVFYKDAKQLLFSAYKVKINQTETAKEKHKIKPLNEVFTLHGTFAGEKLNMKKHELIVDVKAITMHQFEVKRTRVKQRQRRPYTQWKARVVLDI